MQAIPSFSLPTDEKGSLIGLLLEAAVEGPVGVPPVIVNVASGRVVTVRWVIDQLCAMAGVKAALEVDASLVRASDPEEIAGDSSLLSSLTGWRPMIPLEQTLADVLADAASSPLDFRRRR